jgi:hypothetical protein
MPIKLQDLVIDTPGISNDIPLEVTLYQGVGFDHLSSSIPCAYISDISKHQYDKPGKTLVGYVHRKEDCFITMSSEKITPANKEDYLLRSDQDCFFRIHADAIYNIELLHRQ